MMMLPDFDISRLIQAVDDAKTYAERARARRVLATSHDVANVWSHPPGEYHSGGCTAPCGCGIGPRNGASETICPEGLRLARRLGRLADEIEAAYTPRPEF